MKTIFEFIKFLWLENKVLLAVALFVTFQVAILAWCVMDTMEHPVVYAKEYQK